MTSRCKHLVNELVTAWHALTKADKEFLTELDARPLNQRRLLPADWNRLVELVRANA